MSTNWGNGVHTGLDILNRDETKSFEQLQKQVAEMDQTVEKLTEIRNGFDNLIKLVREVDFDRINSTLSTEMMLEIQNTRDTVLDKIKDKLLNL